jgi:hypothetical protein
MNGEPSETQLPFPDPSFPLILQGSEAEPCPAATHAPVLLGTGEGSWDAGVGCRATVGAPTCAAAATAFLSLPHSFSLSSDGERRR